MRNKALFVSLPLILLALAASITVVSAASPELISVTGTQIGAFTNIDANLNDGAIYHYSSDGAGTVTLVLFTGETYKFSSSADVDSMVNTKTDNGVIHYDMKWTLKTGDVELGAFEGQINGYTLTYAYLPNGFPNYPAKTEIHSHAVLHGSGIFDGQTLKLDGVKLVDKALKWEGTLTTQ